MSLDLAGDVAVFEGEVTPDDGCTVGARDAGIFPAHVPVVAVSRSPPSAGTKSASVCKHYP